MKAALRSLNSTWKYKSYNKDALIVMITVLVFRNIIDVDATTKEWGSPFSDYVKNASQKMAT